jgi:hypothetical protein
MSHNGTQEVYVKNNLLDYVEIAAETLKLGDNVVTKEIQGGSWNNYAKAISELTKVPFSFCRDNKYVAYC